MHRQSGNVLFLILIAVALFAALSYAVTSSSRSGGSSTSKEKATASASVILSWLASVDAAVMRLHLSKDLAYEDITFGANAKWYDGTSVSNSYHNARCTTNNCRVFHPDGGGLPQPNFVSYAVTNAGLGPTNTAPGYIGLHTMPWPDAGTSARDVVMIIIGIQPNICDALNQKLDIIHIPTLTGSSPNGNDISAWDSGTRAVSSNPDSISGKHTFASEKIGSGDSTYCNVMHLLIIR